MLIDCTFRYKELRRKNEFKANMNYRSKFNKDIHKCIPNDITNDAEKSTLNDIKNKTYHTLSTNAHNLHILTLISNLQSANRKKKKNIVYEHLLSLIRQYKEAIEMWEIDRGLGVKREIFRLWEKRKHEYEWPFEKVEGEDLE